MGPWGKIRVEKCRDGRKIRVYRDPGMAFRVVFSDYERHFKAGVDAAGQLNANAEASTATETKALLTQLDPANTVSPPNNRRSEAWLYANITQSLMYTKRWELTASQQEQLAQHRENIR